jgi:hypothetical protein
VRAGVIQSSFIPWRGYFDFIASVDVFVFHDDIQYTKGDRRNRNRIKTPKGTEWLTVPVSYGCVSQLICDTRIDYSTRWGLKHSRLWQACYHVVPRFNAVREIISVSEGAEFATISELNIRLIRRICAYLDISTPMLLSSELALEGSKTDRLIDLLSKVKATTYLSGPSADAYLEKEAFRRHGIQLEYKTYDYAPYPQLWGASVGEVTVLDLIANCGEEARGLIRSRTPDVVVTP